MRPLRRCLTFQIQFVGELADIPFMDLTSSIASISSAQTTAKVQMAVVSKIMQVSKDQGQQVANMLSEAVQAMQESIAEFAADAGNQIDTYA